MEIDVDYVARLARIEIAPEKLEQLRRDMAAIVGYIDELKECDVTGIEPTAHAAKLCNVWREDVPGEPYAREEMLANAPAVIQGDLIKVPQVLPGEGMT